MAREQRQYSTEPQVILDISNDMAVIDRVIVKNRCIVMPDKLQKQKPKQLHINHMGMEKPKPKILACESLYWPGINSDIEKFIKNCSICSEFQ